MNKYRFSLFIFITSLLFFLISAQPIDDIDLDNCLIQEISENKGFKFDITTSSHHCLFISINSLSKNGEGILTFNINPTTNQHISSFHSTTIYNIVTPNRVAFYPIHPKDNKFPLEQSYESWYDSNLQNIYHLYFRRESVLSPISKDFLLIYIQYTSPSNEDTNNEEPIIEILPLIILDKAFSNNLSQHINNKYDFSNLTPITKFNPYYAVFTFSGEYINNYLISSQSGYFTYVCDNLIIKKDNKWIINHNRKSVLFTDIYSLNIEGRYCRKFILKYISSNNTSKQYTLTHISIPFKSIQIINNSQYDYHSSHSLIEINYYEDEYRLFNYINDTSNNNEDDSYIMLNVYYGNASLSYYTDTALSSINKLSNETNNRHKNTYGDNDIIKLNKNDYNFFSLKCKEQCLVDIEMFKMFNRGTHQIIFNNYGDFYIVYDTIPSKPIDLIGIELGSFEITFEIIGNDRDFTRIEGWFEGDSFILNDNLYKYTISSYETDEYDDYDQGFSSGEFMIMSKGNNDCIIKISVRGLTGQNFKYINVNTHHEINPGSLDFTFSDIVFQLPKDYNINTFQIQVLLKDENKNKSNYPIQFTSLFQKSTDKDIIIPSIYNHNVNYLLSPTYKYIFEIANPYLYTKDINDDTFYYIIINFRQITSINVFIAFTGIITPNYPLLNLNKFNIIQQHYNEQQSSFLLERGGKFRDSKFIIEFFKCIPSSNINPPLLIKDYFNNTLWETNLDANVLRKTLIDIGIDYTLHIQLQDIKVLLYYTFVPSYLEDILNEREYPKREIIYNETYNERILNIRPFLIGGVNIKYKVYLTELNENINVNDTCIFMEKEPYITEVLSDDNGEDIKIKIGNVKGGKYLIDVIAEKGEPVPRFWIYQRKVVDISEGKGRGMKRLFKVVGSILLGGVLFCIFIRKKIEMYNGGNVSRIIKEGKEMN